jgi:hypothetical protein
MKLGHANDEIKYDTTVGTIVTFLVVLDGEPTMRILCDMADETRTIRIDRADLPWSPDLGHATKGRFNLVTKLTEDSEGVPLGTENRVDRKSVYGYILPRLHVMLGRLLRAA